jgi:hypothetical protein
LAVFCEVVVEVDGGGFAGGFTDCVVAGFSTAFLALSLPVLAHRRRLAKPTMATSHTANSGFEKENRDFEFFDLELRGRLDEETAGRAPELRPAVRCVLLFPVLAVFCVKGFAWYPDHASQN